MLYTVILEFDGTTSVSQLRAPNAPAAFTKWANGLATPAAYSLTPDQATAIRETIEEDSRLQRDLLVPLQHTSNVWCWCRPTAALLRGRRRFILVNLVATDSSAAKRPARKNPRTTVQRDMLSL